MKEPKRPNREPDLVVSGYMQFWFDEGIRIDVNAFDRSECIWWFDVEECKLSYEGRWISLSDWWRKKYYPPIIEAYAKWLDEQVEKALGL